jgi:hypothetical protein
MSEGARVTYATLAAGQSEDFRRRFDEAVEGLRVGLGHDHPHLIDGEGVAGAETFEDRSPADTRLLLGRFPKGTPADVGSTGKSSGGLYYVQQFLREQSRTIAH